MKAEKYLDEKALSESDVELANGIYYKRESVIEWLEDYAWKQTRLVWLGTILGLIIGSIIFGAIEFILG